MWKEILGVCELFVKPFRQLGELFVGMWWVWAAILLFTALVTFVALVVVKFWFGVI